MHSDNRQSIGSASTNKAISAQAVIEPLEGRQLLSAAVHHVAAAPAQSPAIVAGLSPADEKFLQKADSQQELEIQLGAYAGAHGVNSLVTAFGARVVSYETPLLTQLDSLASGLGVTLSNMLDAADQRIANRLENLTGATFDMAYAQQTVTDHTRDIRDYRREAAKTGIVAIQTYINNAIPVLQTDLEFATAARDAVTPQVPPSKVTTPHTPTPTTQNSSGVIEVGTGTSTTTHKHLTPIVTTPYTSAAGQVGASTANLVGTSTAKLVGTGTANLVGVGTANDGTGVQTVVVVSNV
jgi:putative membrane protein